MPQRSTDSQRLDPYKNFMLRMEDGQNVFVGDLRKGLTVSDEVVKHRSGGDPSTPIKSPGRDKYEPITLTRGITVDTSFSSWAAQAGGASSSSSTPPKSTGRSKYDPITVSRGITVDTSFSSWASQVWNFGSSLGSEVSLANFRKDIYLEFYNEAGQLIVDYKISRGWVYEHQILPTPGHLQHLIDQQIGGTVQEKLARIFQDSLDRSGQGVRG